MTIAELFHPEPEQWGLRGDPYLWREMKNAFADTPMPESGEEFRVKFESAFLDFVGVPLDDREHHYVERYSHGGMSSGQICFDFWSKHATSILTLRFANAQNKND